MIVGGMFMLIAGAIMLTIWTMALCTALAGRFLAQRKHYVFCIVVAGINCMHAPLGMALGVFTLIVLTRPTVKQMFEMNALPAAEPGSPHVRAG
jgi:hypothetical protein